MSLEQFEAFLSKVKDDSSIQAKLKTAASSTAVVDIAREAGVMISADDLKQKRTLSENELEGISGGWPTIDCDAG